MKKKKRKRKGRRRALEEILAVPKTAFLPWQNVLTRQTHNEEEEEEEDHLRICSMLVPLCAKEKNPLSFVEMPVHPHTQMTVMHSSKTTFFSSQHEVRALALHGKIRALQSLGLSTAAQMEIEDACTLSRGQSLVASLKVCAEQETLGRGLEVHAEIARYELFKTDIYVGSTLIDMYGKCGSLLKAQEVFDTLTFRNVVTWNALISIYVLHGRGETALRCFDQMQREGISVDAVTLTCSAKACAKIKAIQKGCEIHAEIMRKGLLTTTLYVGNTLIDMYVKFGLLENANEVFHMLPTRNVVTWTALIAGYAQHDCGENALGCFGQMQCEGVPPNAATYACALKACCSMEAVEKGVQMHVAIACNKLLKTDLFVGSTLVDLYAKCGLLEEARKVFDTLLKRNVVTWTALIAGYVQHEQNEEALECFEQMQAENVAPNVVTFACCLKACGSIGAYHLGNEVYAEIARKGLLRGNLVLETVLVDMYSKCGLFVKAQEVFDRLVVRDVVSWSALISGYADHDCGEAAIACVEQMQVEGIFADSVITASCLKACSSIEASKKGVEIHAKLVEEGIQDAGPAVNSALVDFHSKCTSLAKAKELFDILLVKDVIAWNALIGGYIRHERGEDALDCFMRMQTDDVVPDMVAFSFVLKACGMLGDMDKGTRLHAEVAKNGLLKNELSVGNALVDMYAKCGFLAEAQEVFVMLPTKDVVTWNALIGGFAQYNREEEALKCFEDMQLNGIAPNSVTYTCVLKVCGSLGAGEKGNDIHIETARKKLFAMDLFIGSVLVDMYAKCGSLAKATEVFRALPVRNTITWNALITGYSQSGDIDRVLFTVDRMAEGGNWPDSVTTGSILNTCSHAGLVDMSCKYFKHMSDYYGVLQTLSHYTCMVDLLGRSGRLDEALLTLRRAPFHPNAIMWLALLSACRKWGNVELGRHAFDQALRLDENFSAAYVGMYNIYADADMQEDARKVEALTALTRSIS